MTLRALISGLRPGVVAVCWPRDLGPAAMAMLRSGTPGEIDSLLRSGMRVDAVDGYGRSLLHLAAAAGETHVVRHLLERGASILQNPHDGRTPLHEACMGGHPATIALLLRAGASAVARDGRGHTPADCATANGHHEAVRSFLTSSFGSV